MRIKQALTYSRLPRLDSEWLLLHVLGRRESSWLYASGEEFLTAEQQQLFGRLASERLAGKPLAYILGEWEFYGRRFYVDERVLIPRPSTEALVEAALGYSGRQKKGQVIADIGTGSGCLAITLALESAIKNLEINVVATDIAPAALKVARRNAAQHGVLDQIEFLEGDMLTPLLGLQLDLIVSNPPYVPTQEVARAGQAPDTAGLSFEPRVALDGGEDGQYFVQQLAACGVPALVEVSSGEVRAFNVPLKKERERGLPMDKALA